MRASPRRRVVAAAHLVERGDCDCIARYGVVGLPQGSLPGDLVTRDVGMVSKITKIPARGSLERPLENGNQSL